MKFKQATERRFMKYEDTTAHMFRALHGLVAKRKDMVLKLRRNGRLLEEAGIRLKKEKKLCSRSVSSKSASMKVPLEVYRAKIHTMQDDALAMKHDYESRNSMLESQLKSETAACDLHLESMKFKTKTSRDETASSKNEVNELKACIKRMDNTSAEELQAHVNFPKTSVQNYETKIETLEAEISRLKNLDEDEEESLIADIQSERCILGKTLRKQRCKCEFATKSGHRKIATMKEQQFQVEANCKYKEAALMIQLSSAGDAMAKTIEDFKHEATISIRSLRMRILHMEKQALAIKGTCVSMKEGYLKDKDILLERRALLQSKVKTLKLDLKEMAMNAAKLDEQHEEELSDMKIIHDSQEAFLKGFKERAARTRREKDAEFLSRHIAEAEWKQCKHQLEYKLTESEKRLRGAESIVLERDKTISMLKGTISQLRDQVTALYQSQKSLMKRLSSQDYENETLKRTLDTVAKANIDARHGFSSIPKVPLKVVKSPLKPWGASELDVDNAKVGLPDSAENHMIGEIRVSKVKQDNGTYKKFITRFWRPRHNLS